mgnify:CR=1 FL=1
MNNIREIVTKAVVSKGKKTIRIKDVIVPCDDSFSILGCWVINHAFSANFDPNCKDLVRVNGNFEVNIWYSYDNNHKTEVARMISDYNDKVYVRKVIQEDNDDLGIIAKVTKQPTVVNACIVEDGMSVDINLELVVEVIGETKILVTTFPALETTCVEDDFENEINEDFLNDIKDE